MAERLIFEFRATQGKGGVRFHVRHGDERVSVCDVPIGGCCRPHSSRSRKRERPRRHRRQSEGLRQTLDFLEQLYQDLYGDKQEQGKWDDPQGSIRSF